MSLINDDPESRAKRICELICQLTRICSIKEDYFAAGHDLTPAEVRLLECFGGGRRRLPVKELGAVLKLSPGRVTQIVEALEKKKLVGRIADPQDRRNIHVVLRAGRRSGNRSFCKDLQQRHDKLNAKILSLLSTKKQKEILSSLETLAGVFQTWLDQNKNRK